MLAEGKGVLYFMSGVPGEGAEVSGWWSEENARSSSSSIFTHALRSSASIQSYAVLADVASNMRSGLLLLDQEEQVVFSNPSAERLLGVSLREILELPVFDVRHHLLSLAASPERTGIELDRLWLHPDEEQTADFALADAAERWLRVHAFPVRGETGALLGRGILLDDITLEHDSMQARSETLALAAHELKTPLAVIKGSATTLLGNAHRWDPAMLREMLQMIDTQADRLHDVLNTLLDVWRIDAGVQQLRLSEVRVGELLTSLVERWRKNAPRHTFNLRLPSETVVTQCDALRLEQAVNQLLNNAVTYSPIGSTVTLRLETNDDELRLSVADQGIGIAPEHLERIFTRFYREQQSDKGDRAGERPVGSGLGLAVARSTIEAHGGKIWAESGGRGRGSTFYFTLPLASSQVRSLSSASTAQATTPTSPLTSTPTGPLNFPHSGPLRTHRRVNIVVVEQDQRMARYVRANLEEQRYQVYTVAHGHQFLRQLDLQEPDLVLLASDAGDMTGADLLQRLREFSRVPVLMLCGDSEDEDERVRYLDMGADDFVVKPLSMKELLARVRVLLRRHPSRDESAGEPVFSTGGMLIDFAQRQVLIQGREVQLSRTEYRLLSVLAQNAGRVMTHELLLERVWGAEYSREVDFIWVYISRLRRKIEADPRHPSYILTVPDVGYKLAKL
jgi:DNA-binding response OmpR family regulator/signal transduction histidine kinase